MNILTTKKPALLSPKQVTTSSLYTSIPPDEKRNHPLTLHKASTLPNFHQIKIKFLRMNTSL
jgi:hypothetical protein